MHYFVIGGNVENESEHKKEQERLKESCVSIGKAICELGHSLIICSPFEDSADYWVLEGFAKGNLKDEQVVKFYYVDTEFVRAEVDRLESKFSYLRFIKVPHPAFTKSTSNSMAYSWLLCQLDALESCQLMIAIGGKLDGSANMLLLFAESKRKNILPLSFLGGAAAQSFYRSRFELKDRLENDYLLLQEEKDILGAINLGEKICGTKKNHSLLESDSLPPKIFISYPRIRPAEADYIENLLRRRNMQVYRDESKFGAGHAIPKQIREAVFEATIFIAIWCAEYACSPWCYDELELALDRHEEEKIEIWLICVDETRIVPTRARDLLSYPVKTREEIEGKILGLLK